MALQQNFRSAFSGFNREDVVHYLEQVNAKHHAELNRMYADTQYLQEQLNRYELAAGEEGACLLLDLEQQLQTQTQRADALEAELEQARADRQYSQAAEEKLADQARQIETLEQRVSRHQSSHQAEIALLEGKISEQREEIHTLRRQLAESQETARQAKQDQAQTKEENDSLQALLDTALSRQSHVQSQQEAELSAYRRAERVERQAKERAVQIRNHANEILSHATTKAEEAATYFTLAAEQVMEQIQCLQQAVHDSQQILKDASACLYTINSDEE